MSGKKSFWTTLPGIFTAAAGLVTAVAGLIAILYQVGVIGQRQVASPGGPRIEEGARTVPNGDTPSPPPASRGFRVVEAFLRADPIDYSGPCPVAIRFTGRISVVGGSGVVSYKFTRSDGASAPIKTITFDQPGSKDVHISWKLGSTSFTYSGWQAIRIFEPQELESNRASFNIKCKKKSVDKPPLKKPMVSQADYNAVQQIYGAHKLTDDCSEIKRIAKRLTRYYSNNNLVPEDARYSVLYPSKKKVPTIADLARDRYIRVRRVKRTCF